MRDTFPSVEYIGFAVAFSVMIIADLVGNSLVILVITRNPNMRTSMNYVLVNLAIADILVAIFMGMNFVVTPAFVQPDGTIGRCLCKFLTGGTSAWTAAVASVYSLVAVAFEVYNAAFNRFRSPTVAKGKSLRRKLCLIWLIALLWGLPLYISVTYVDELKTCAEQWSHPIMPLLYSLGWIIVAGVIPMTVMGVLYFKVMRAHEGRFFGIQCVNSNVSGRTSITEKARKQL